MVHSLIFDNPGTVFLIVFTVVLLAFYRANVDASKLRAIAAAGGILGIGCFVTVDAMNLFRGGMLWHDAANILSISAAYLRGQPMYTAPSAADFYSLFYGPGAFLVYLPFLAALRHPEPWMRLAISGANLCSFGLMYAALRRFVSRAEAAGLMSVAVAMLLARPNELLGFRGDCWLLLCASTVVWLLVRGGDRALAMLAVGVACGIAVDFKVTSLVMAAFALCAILLRRGVKACIISVVGFFAVASGVFLLPRISIANYAHALALSSHQRFLRSTLLENMVVAAMLLAPVVVLLMARGVVAQAYKRDRALWVAGFLAVAMYVVTGAKDSAGFWHLWPFLPFLLAGTAYEAAWVRRTSIEAPAHNAQANLMAVVWMAASVGGGVMSIYFAQKDVRVLRPIATAVWKTREADALAELQHVVNALHSRNLSMGYGLDITDYRSNLRYVLPLARQQYFFDENEVIEATKERLPVPPNIVQRVLGCEDDWLVPHGDVPFTALRARVLPWGSSPYIFPDELRLGFPATHSLLKQGEFYDLWGCRATGGTNPSLY